MAVAPWFVSDELWELVEPLLPRKERRFRYPGRKRLADREALQGILFVLPDPGPLPLVQAPPTGHARTESELARHVLPGDPGVQVRDSAVPAGLASRPGHAVDGT